MTSDFHGRVALVTGASLGIGLAIATELARRGAAVTISSRKPDQIAAAADQVRNDVPGARVFGVAANTGKDEDRAEVVRRTMDEFGRLDVLINNTGINPVADPLASIDLGAVRKIFDVNVVGALGFVQLALSAWMASNGGSIVNIASIAGLRSSGPLAVYGASKAALIRLTEELAWQLGPKVRVNAVAPAVVKTKFAEMLYGGREEEVASSYPMKRLGETADVAQLVAFLASDQASWITGETVRVDGGMLATGVFG